MDVIQLKKALKVFKLDDSALEGYIQLYNKFHAKPKKLITGSPSVHQVMEN